MSEFCCWNGHLMKAGEFVCPQCGRELATMDGMTDKQIRQQAEDEERRSDENEDSLLSRDD